jgi:uncharacterized repeat protein (TIGR01451 family)
MLKICGLVLFFLVQAGAVHAENINKKDVEVSLQQYKVGQAGRAEVLDSSARVKPSEVIEYQVSYRNVSNHLVRQLHATLPIPRETEYVPNSGHPQNMKASLDGVTYEPIPLRRVIRLPNGQVEEQEVPTSEYRSLRWSLGDLPVNQKATVSARMRIAPPVNMGVAWERR